MANNRRGYDLGEFDETTRSVRVIASTKNAVEGEALESWDLSRYMKNPVVLWGHDGNALPIGRADEITQGPEGLSMRIVFAPEAANPMAGYVAHLVRGKFLRGVSVGFEPGVSREEERDGQKVKVRSANDLLEVSFVSIPKDEDAGTSAISEAGRALAKHRTTIQGMHADAGDEKTVREGERFDAALTKVEWTAWGTARIPARISRVGVLPYPGRREFRPPSEVLKPESVASLKGMPVIDITDHTDFVRPQDFRRKVLGFVEEVHVDGEYVAGTLHIHDGPTIESIKRGERLDVSAGYHAPTVPAEGMWQGERYDFVQRDIIYNHVALCPPGRGRAGSEVGLKLDANGNRAGGHMSEVKEKRFIRLDGKDVELHSEAHFDKIESAHKAEKAELQKKLDETSGRLDAAEKAVETSKREKSEAETKAKEAAKEREKDLAQRVKSRVRLVMRALRLFGQDDEEGDDEEKKMDSLAELSERELHLKAILKAEPDFKADGLSDDFVAGKFEGAMKYLAKTRGVDGVVHVLEGRDGRGQKLDSTDRREHPVDKARRENFERMKKMSEPASAREGGAQ